MPRSQQSQSKEDQSWLRLPLPSKPSSTSKRRPVMIIAMIPTGAVLGFLGGLLIEIIVGLIARSVFSAEHPGAQAWQLRGSLPGLGALIGAILVPILYGRSGRSVR
jgi:hypothetical protein